jgi:hypothetical protein
VKKQLSRQPGRHIAEGLQRGLQVFDDLLLQHVRGWQVVQIFQAVVLQPEDVQARLVAGNQSS